MYFQHHKARKIFENIFTVQKLLICRFHQYETLTAECGSATHARNTGKECGTLASFSFFG